MGAGQGGCFSFRPAGYSPGWGHPPKLGCLDARGPCCEPYPVSGEHGGLWGLAFFLPGKQTPRVPRHRHFARLVPCLDTSSRKPCRPTLMVAAVAPFCRGLRLTPRAPQARGPKPPVGTGCKGTGGLCSVPAGSHAPLSSRTWKVTWFFQFPRRNKASRKNTRL